MEDHDAYRRAKKRVEARWGFYIHLVIYLVVNAGLIFINMTTSPEYPWVGWPMFGWGIGLFFHGMGVFVFTGGDAMKEKMIEKEMKREASRKRQ